MRRAGALVTWAVALALAVGACGGGEEPAQEETVPAGETVMAVPDSTIEREVQTRLDADPRLDKEGIVLRVRAEDGIVNLIGSVPSRMEMSIAREVAISAPGVVNVNMDSLDVASERQES
jgi:osmotically-inducible protein OsmY